MFCGEDSVVLGEVRGRRVVGIVRIMKKAVMLSEW